MKTSRIITAICVVIITAVLGMSVITAAEDTMSFSRIYVYMPDITVEVKGTENVDVSQITAKLGNKSLAVESAEEYSEDSHTAKVYVLLDISSGTSDEYFEAMLDAVDKYITSFSDNTAFEMYTFGDSVEQLLDGSESDSKVSSRIQSLSNDDNERQLYEAICSVYEAATVSESVYDREYMIVFTGAEDNQTGKTTYSEAKTIVADKSIPVYMMLTEESSSSGINKAAAFARKTGATYKTFNSSNIDKNFKKLKKVIKNVVIVKLKASTNVAGGSKKLLELNISGTSVSEYVKLINSKEDNTAPQVTSVSGDKEKNAIVIAYSEPMSGAGNILKYSVTDSEGEQIKIENVEYDSNTISAYLYAADTLYNDTYSITFSGITDASESKNALNADGSYEVAGLEEKPGFFAEHKQVFIYAAIILLIVGLLITIIIVVSVKKKKAAETVTVDDISEIKKDLVRETNEILVSNVKEKTNIRHHIQSPSGRKIRITVNMNNRTQQTIDTEIISSIIVGRAQECDICIDDTNMSRQHFAIEDIGGRLILTDLNSSNGTYLNGIMINGKYVLENGSKISAGATDFILKI